MPLTRRGSFWALEQPVVRLRKQSFGAKKHRVRPWAASKMLAVHSQLPYSTRKLELRSSCTARPEDCYDEQSGLTRLSNARDLSESSSSMGRQRSHCEVVHHGLTTTAPGSTPSGCNHPPGLTMTRVALQVSQDDARMRIDSSSSGRTLIEAPSAIDPAGESYTYRRIWPVYNRVCTDEYSWYI